MEKTVRAFIFLLLTCTVLFAVTNYTKELEKYDAQMSYASSDEMLKVFHGLKSVYIHAIISSDDELKKETLERLIKSAKILKIDASKYESELVLMKKGVKKIPTEEKFVPIKRAVETPPVPLKTYENRVPITPSKLKQTEVISQPSFSNTKKSLKRDKIIVIDAGHGGEDAGATGYKQKKEKHLVLDIALQLGKNLKEKGYKIFYTRDKDFFVQLRDRTKIANDKNADLFISVHANAAPNESKQLSMKGIETFFLSPGKSERSKNVAALENKSNMEEMDLYSKETFLNVFNREKIVLSNKAAIDIQSSMLKNIKKKYEVDDGGVREAPFWVLVGATMPSILLEIGYITNPDESGKLFNIQYQKLLVDGISDGIDKYFTNNP
ncbi:MAG: N-acetylmuramoyl-L-alanine amidase [Campylobacteraceae bacterium]|nr:N-acetylmuramoyl-L-alanine amidase [Campylobacteraceae bacterium]